MDRKAWQIKQEAFDRNILEQIKMFRIEDLSDPQIRQNWLEVAKRFSRMKLTPQIINSMSYEDFMTLRCIMSSTLGDLSRKTDQQRQKIMGQEQALAKLKHEQQKLTQIYNDNLQKSKQVKQKLDKLKEQVYEDALFQYDSQQPSKQQ